MRNHPLQGRSVHRTPRRVGRRKPSAFGVNWLRRSFVHEKGTRGEASPRPQQQNREDHYDNGRCLSGFDQNGNPDGPSFCVVMITMFLGSPRLHFVYSALAGRVHSLLAGRPRTLVAIVAFLAMAMFATAGWTQWFSYELTAGLPDRGALKTLGDMSQATTILDASDKPAFTIFKEQRLDVPIDRMSPALDQGSRLCRGSALLRPQRGRRDSRGGRGPAEFRGRPAR